MWTIIKRNMKVVVTCNLYLSMLSLGLALSIIGPCLLDLQELVDTDTTHIALMFTSRAVGYLAGAVIGGTVLGMVRSKLLILTACNFFIAFTMFGMPWSRNIEMLMVFAILNGLSLGVLETEANVLCIEMWGSGPILQGFYFTFGFGSLVSPAIAAPFLKNQPDLQNSISNATYLSELDLYGNSTSNFSFKSSHEEMASITYPFSIVGAFATLVTILFFTSCLIYPMHLEETVVKKQSKSNNSCFFTFGAIIFCFLIFFVVTGTEIGFGQMLTTYAVKCDLHLSTTLGSYMTSTYWAAFTIMRLVSVFLSFKLSGLTMTILNTFLIAISGLLLLFFMPNEWALWAASVTYGAGVSSTYASLIGWLDNYVKITNKISAIFCISNAAGEMVVPILIAYFMEIMPEMFAYVTAASSVLSAFFLLILFLIFKIFNNSSTLEDTKNKVTETEA